MYLLHANKTCQMVKLDVLVLNEKNLNFLDSKDVKVHLYKKGFTPDNWYWTCHRESDPNLYNAHPNLASKAQEGHNEHFDRFESITIEVVKVEFGGHYDQQND